MDSLHIMHININGLFSKKNELLIYASENDPDVICINETKLIGKTPYKIPGFSEAVFRNRTVSRVRGGGVAIYVSTRLSFIDISPDMDDISAILIQNGDFEIAIISYYCPPLVECELDTRTLQNLLNKYKNCAILGDLNAKHIFFGSNSTNTRGEFLFNLVEQNDALVANDPAQLTRMNPVTGKFDLLDYAIISKPLIGKLVSWFTGDDIGSDHLTLHLLIKFKRPSAVAATTSVRAFKKCDWKVFDDFLTSKNTELTHYPSAFTASVLDSKAIEFESAISMAYETACPLVKVRQYQTTVS